MALFGLRKPLKKTKKVSQKEQQNASSCPIKILGAGCASCTKLEEHTHQALEELGMHLCIEHVSDSVTIARYGVMSTPALVVDEKVLASGRVLSKEEICNLLQSRRGGSNEY